MNLQDLLPVEVRAALSDEAMEATCRACGNRGLVGFYEANNLPTQTCVLLNDRATASAYPTGDLLLAFCEPCGFIQNTRFDPTIVDYSKATEESQAFSPLFQSFASDLASELIARFDLVGRSVLEVGCGKGDFLALLASRGISSGFGIDPGYLPNRPEAAVSELRFERGWYDGSRTDLTADLVITRHLMEHVPNVREFFDWLSRSTRATESAAMFTEVPDVRRVLDTGAFWDVYYEHCSYFTLGSIARTIRRAGFEITGLRMGFADQYLLVDARPGRSDGVLPAEDQPHAIGNAVARFSTEARSKVAYWRERIGRLLADGRSVAVWGGGSKAVAFLSTIGIDHVSVVDINPHKQGRWLPTIAVEVVSPDRLMESHPDLVIPMNPIYADEIRSDMRRMDLEADLEPI